MIVPMKRLTLIAMKADEKRIVGALQSMAAVQIISTGDGGADEDQSLAQLESRLQRLDGAQQILRPYAEKSKLGAKPEFSVQALREGMDASLELCGEVEQLDHELASVRNDIDKRGALIESLRPWSGFEADIAGVKSTDTVRYLTGMLPPEQIEVLTAAGAHVEVYGGEKERAVLIICHGADYAELSQLIKTTDFAEFVFPPLTGTPQENIDRLEAEIGASRARETELASELAAAAKKRDKLLESRDAAIIDRDCEAGCTLTQKTATSFILEGWVRQDRLEQITNAVHEITDTCYIDFQEPAEDETPPVALENSKLVKPYEAVTNLYSLPAAGSIDGTPFFAPFYFVFFGMMLSDSGYGIILFVGTLLFLKFLKPSGMMEGLAKVLCMGGLSTMVFGLLLGTFFGMSWSTVFSGLSFQNVFPLIDSNKDPLIMLGLCFGLGLIHMFYAVIIAIIECFRKGDWVAAVVDNMTWLFIVTGLLLLAAPMIGLPAGIATAGKLMAIAGAATVFLFAGRGKKLPGRLVSGAGKLYDITSWLADVLSYSRIFALGLSTGVIGVVLNTLGGMLYSAFQHGLILQGIGFLLTGVLLAALHLFMMAISTLGSFVHCARLQYVEFFGKFYESGGKPFKPLGYGAKHVRITQ